MTLGSLPRWAWLPAGLGLLFLVLPLVGLGSRIPWARLPELLTRPESLDAFGLSLRTCALSTLVTITLGLPMALVMSRLRGRWAQAARTLAVLPMVLPPVVAGLALLMTLGRRGLLGESLDLIGIRVGFSTVAVIIAQTFVSMPFFVIAVEGSLRTLDTEYEHAAAALGATPTYTLRRVTLPLVGPAIAAGATLAFARALGEFGATLTFAGSLQGTTRTLPLEIYLQREIEPDIAASLSLLLITVAALLVATPGLFRPRAAA